MADHTVGIPETVEERLDYMESELKILANKQKNAQDLSLLLQRLDALESLVKEQHETFKSLAKALWSNAAQRSERSSFSREYSPVRSKSPTKVRSPSIPSAGTLAMGNGHKYGPLDLEKVVHGQKNGENKTATSRPPPPPPLNSPTTAAATAARVQAFKDKADLKQRKAAYAAMALHKHSQINHGNRQTSLAVEAARREVKRSEAQAVVQAIQQQSVLYSCILVFLCLYFCFWVLKCQVYMLKISGCCTVMQE